jgi:hypothetical protein
MLKESDIKIIENGGEIILSSRRARSQQLILLISITIFLAFFTWYLRLYQNNYLILLIILGAIIAAFLAFILSRLHTATLSGTNLLVKGFLGYETTIPIKDVKSSSTYQMKRTAYLKIDFSIKGKSKTLYVLKPSKADKHSDPAFVLEYARRFYRKKQ